MPDQDWPAYDTDPKGWQQRAQYEHAEKIRMESRLADLLRQTGRWYIERVERRNK